MENLLKALLSNYMNSINGVLAVAICDRDGLIITSISKGGAADESVLGALSAVLDSFIDRIKSEFSTQSNFCNITAIGDKKFIYCSTGPKSILTTIAEPSTTDIELRVFSEHVAQKIELILEGNDKVNLEIPAIIKAISRTRGGVLPQGEFSVKLILTGDFQVGKTSLIRRFVENRFQESYISTIGVEISKKVVDIAEKTKINFIIWDIGGQITQMAPYRQRFYNGANAAFIVIDRTRQSALKSIETWYKDIKSSVPSRIPMVIVGNKSDAAEKVVIKDDDIKMEAEQFGFHYILTSAKTGESVNDAFLYSAYKFLENI